MALFQKAAKIAEEQHISVEHLVSSALTEQLRLWELWKSRAAAASHEDFLKVMSKVPDVEPDEHDRL